MKPHYKQLPGNHRYYIGTDGTVFIPRISRLAKVRRRYTRKGKYERIGISSGSRTNSITKTVHQLVMLTHVGKPRLGQVVDHIDGNKFNNNLSNLQYMGMGENSRKGNS